MNGSRKVILAIEEVEEREDGTSFRRREEVCFDIPGEGMAEKVLKFQKFVERVRRTIGVMAAA